MAATVQRKLVVTADTSGLARGARDVRDFGQGVTSTAEMLKNAKANLDPNAYRAFAASLKPAIEAEKQMAAVTRQVAADLKPFAAEMRKVQAESMKAAEALTKRSLSEMKAAEALRKRYDEGYANAQRYMNVERDVARQVELRNLTMDEGNTILASAGVRFKQMGDAANEASGRIRLTSGQMQGFGYQLNDMGTMLAMGASPFQIIASQAGQVAQVMGDGPGGVKGTLSAIGSGIAGFARAIPTAGYAVAGLTAGVGALWYMTSGPEARSAEESLKTFEDAIKRLEGNWKSAADAARDHFDAATRSGDNPNAAFLDVGGNIRQLQTDLKATIRDLNTSDALSGTILRPFSGAVSDARREISGLYSEMLGGERTVQSTAAALLKIRLDPEADDHARAFADEIRRALDPAIALERQIQALNNSAAQMAARGRGTTSRNGLHTEDFQDRFGPTIGGNNRFGDSEAMDSIRQGLKDQRTELEGNETALRSYSDAVREQRDAMAGSISELRLQVDMFGQSEGAIAAARFRMDAMAEAQRQANDAKQSAIDPALLEQINRESAEYGALTDRLNGATEAQRERTRAEQEAQRERERIVEKMTRQRERVAEFEADLAFDRSILTLPDAEQDVRSTIRDLGVDFDSFEGQRIAAAMRYNEAIREQQDAMVDMGDVAEDVFGSIIDSLGKGGDLLGNLAEAVGGLGKQLASAGMERMFGGLFGSPTSSTGSGGAAGVLSALASGARFAANQNTAGGGIPIPTTRPAYVAEAAAAVSGQVMTYAKRFNSGVDSRLMTILETAAQRFPMKVEAISGLASRPGNKGFHPKGLAADVQIYGANGYAYDNYQHGPDFRVYEQYAQVAKTVQQELFPELDKLFTFGGYFKGPKGHYGALDSMHFDLGGANRMQGGTWATGLNDRQRGYFPGVQSVGMGASSPNQDQRLIARGVSAGMQDFARTGGAESYASGRFDAGTPANPGGAQMSHGQAGLGVLGAAAGIFGQGYASGDIFSGSIGGALGGFGAAGSIASAFPALAGIAGPIGLIGGAAIGALGSPIGGGKINAKAHRARAERFDHDGDQHLLAA